jgi:hypothetical protein
MLGSHNLGDAQASVSGSDGATGQGKRRRTGRRRRRRHGVAFACASSQAQRHFALDLGFDRVELVAALD